MEDLIARIREALDEDERIALAALNHPGHYGGEPWDWIRTGDDDGVWAADGCVVDGGIHIYDEGGHDEHQAAHIARHDPARVLRQVAAHRKILKAHPIHTEQRGWDGGSTWYGCRCALDDEGDILFSREVLCDIIPPLAEAYGITVEVTA